MNAYMGKREIAPTATKRGGLGPQGIKTGGKVILPAGNSAGKGRIKDKQKNFSLSACVRIALQLRFWTNSKEEGIKETAKQGEKLCRLTIIYDRKSRGRPPADWLIRRSQHGRDRRSLRNNRMKG